MKTLRALWIVMLPLAFAACRSSEATAPATQPAVDASAEAPDDGASAEAAGDSTAEPAPDTGPSLVELKIFTTSDEHGWLEPITQTGAVLGGAANTFAWMKEKSGFDPSKDLLLSSGDTWGGPAISDYFQGEPVVAAFNLMGYSAVAVGNHEYDFGRDVLLKRMGEANFKFLSANTRYKSSGEQVDYAVPYAIFPVQGVQVGVIGLITPQAALSANPKYTSDIQFDDPKTTIEQFVPKVKAAGAEVVLVIAHESNAVMVEVAKDLTVHVDAIFTGHDHGLVGSTENDMLVGGSGSQWQQYRVTSMLFDRDAHAVKSTQSKVLTVSYEESGSNPVTPDPALTAMIAPWRADLDQALSKEIGYTVTGIDNMTWPQVNWATDAWAATFPTADIVLQNVGGFRQAIPAGPIKIEAIYNMMPFANRILQLQVTGQQLVDNLLAAFASCGGVCVAPSGITYKINGQTVEVTLKGGAPLDLNATYKVLVNDFMAAGGAGFLFAKQGIVGVDMGVNYRDPVVDWTTQLGTTASDPLEAHIDPAPRGQ